MVVKALLNFRVISGSMQPTSIRFELDTVPERERFWRNSSSQNKHLSEIGDKDVMLRAETKRWLKVQFITIEPIGMMSFINTK